MKIKTLLLILSIIAIAVIVSILYDELTIQYSRTPVELMHNLEIAVNSGDPKEVAALFATDYAYNRFLQVTVESDSSKISKTPLIRHKGQPPLDAWKKWFKKYGISALRFYSKRDQTICTTEGDLNFIITIRKYKRGYIIYDCEYSI